MSDNLRPTLFGGLGPRSGSKPVEQFLRLDELAPLTITWPDGSQSESVEIVIDSAAPDGATPDLRAKRRPRLTRSRVVATARAVRPR